MDVSIGRNTQHQIVFVGSFGVGKTTALRAISDIDVVNMDVKSDEIAQQNLDPSKTTTTVGFDYGECVLGGDERVALYGIPGQSRFDEIWDRVLPNSSAIVLWVYGDREDALTECQRWLDILKERNAIERLCVAVTRIDPNDVEALGAYRGVVAKYHPFAPIITSDPRDKNSVIQATMVALSTPSVNN